MKKQTINPLLPIIDPQQLVDTKTGELSRIRYRSGFPKVYQLNLAGIVGKLSVMNEEELTKKGEDFAFVPLAYRYFEGALFGQPWKKWMEVYFLNQYGWVCQLMFSAHNAENLINVITDAEIYRDLQLGQFGINVKLNTRSVTLPNDEKANYFACGFSFYELNDEQQATTTHIFTNLAEPLYRADIADPACQLVTAQNWNLRPEPEQTLPEYVAGLEEEQAAATAAS